MRGHFPDSLRCPSRRILLRILIDGRYINDGFPGIGRYTFNLIVALAELETGDVLVVLVNSRLRNRRYDLNRLAALPGCRVEDCRVDRFLPSELVRLGGVVHRLKPDIFHSPFYLRPYPLHVPCIQTIHDLIPMEVPEELGKIGRIVFLAGVSLACRSAAAVLTVSELSAGALRRRFPAAAGRIHVTLPAPDPGFRPLPEERIQEALRRVALDGRRYVLHLSSGLPHKNVRLLLEAWARYVSRRPRDGRLLVLAGDYGRRHAEFAAVCGRLGLRGAVRFPGELDDGTLTALYNGADLCVFPAATEGFGLPVVEAMACGAPVITTDPVAAAASLGDSALLVPANALAPLVDALDNVLADEGLRKTLSARGLARAASYSWKATAQATHDVYRLVAGKRRLSCASAST